MTLFKKAIYAIALTSLVSFNLQAAENKTHLIENIKHEVVEDNSDKQVFEFSNVEYCQLKNSRQLDNLKLRRYERHFLSLGGTKESISKETCLQVKQEYPRLKGYQVDEILLQKFY
jgi:hypothetical protein